MLNFLPPDDVLYAALVARDPAWDGRAWVGVATTGILCRLTCPARKPLARNCRFFGSTVEGLAAGFRPCLRCKPLGGPADDPLVVDLLARLAADPARRWSEADLTAIGLDPSSVRRAFRRALGVTFLDHARTLRLGAAAGRLAGGGRVIEAQLDAGFESPSAFRAAFARLLGISPGAFAGDGAALLKAHWIEGGEGALGPMIAVADERALYLLEFTSRKALPAELKALARAANGGIGLGPTAITERVERELATYFRGEGAQFTVPLAPLGTPFQKQVWAALRRIPAGEVRSYSDIARAIGRPEAVRAVAAANGANPVALMIPCHRVIGADGSLTGYGGGLWRKDRLLALERGYAGQSGRGG